MKRLMILAWVALMLTGLVACGQRQTGTGGARPQESEGLRVVATIFPPYDFVREIAGDRVELSMLLPPGSESHSYEPSPQDIITIQKCDVFIYVGGDSDHWVEQILSSMDTSGMEVVAMLDLVDAVEEELVEGMQDVEHAHDHSEQDDHDHDAHEQDHDHEAAEGAARELDEHVWTSPVNAMRIVEALASTLCELDPGNAGEYERNTTAYIGQLQALDNEFRQVVAEGQRTTLVFGDRFPFRYLAEEYGLNYFAAFPGCSTETEASAATVAFLIDKVADEEIPLVLYIEFSNEKMADTICEQTGADKRQMHSCHNLSRDDIQSGVSYLALMRENAQVLREALS